MSWGKRAPEGMTSAEVPPEVFKNVRLAHAGLVLYARRLPKESFIYANKARLEEKFSGVPADAKVAFEFWAKYLGSTLVIAKKSEGSKNKKLFTKKMGKDGSTWCKIPVANVI